MRLGRLVLILPILAAAVYPAAAASLTHARRGPTSPKLSSKRAPRPKLLSQREIDPSRTTQLQAALIKSGYLTGQPTGVWDSTTEAAMQKLQGDNGWQTKLVPDARAIIKLGLGPAADSALFAGNGAGEDLLAR